MAEVTNELLMEVLRTIRGDIGELKEAHRQTHRRLSAIEHQLISINLNVNGHTDDIESLRERVERIERRLELTD